MSIKNPMVTASIALAITAVVAISGIAYLVSHKTKPSVNSTQNTSTTPSQNPQTSSKDAKGAPTPVTEQTPPKSTPTTTPPPAAPQASTGPVVSGTTTISISGTAFNPASLTIKKGTVVTWSNTDTSNHAIAENDSSNGPRSPQLKPNESYTYTFSATGTYHYVDVINPALTGTITVI